MGVIPASSANGSSVPPSAVSRSLVFLIGQDCDGHWVAREQSGACGGLFANRAAALKFVRSENGHSSPRVVFVSEMLEFDTTARNLSLAHRGGSGVRLKCQVA